MAWPRFGRKARASWCAALADLAADLSHGWVLAATPPGQCPAPVNLPWKNLTWRPALVPGTVAASLTTTLDAPDDLESVDWWYRCTFAAEVGADSARYRLRFAGLATLAEVWLNGVSILTSRNMFREHLVNIDLGPGENEIVVVFRSLRAELSRKQPRPRWKAGLLDHQNLRWVRTSLLGHIPGWSPRLAPIGPWREITLERVPAVEESSVHLIADAVDGVARVRCFAEFADGTPAPTSATVNVGTLSLRLTLEQRDGATLLAGTFLLPDVPLWWPHTHGEPHLEACTVTLALPGRQHVIDFGRVGFRSVGVDRADGNVQLLVNGVPVFCRGACWTVDDIRALDGSLEQRTETLRLARAAGVNMIRVGGTMTYAAEDVYRTCDTLGILVWQDFMFANMDYPFEDAAFLGDVEAEVTAQLNRLQKRACVAVYCGSSEVQQQAAMVGIPQAEWIQPFFSTTLPAWCERHHPGIPYFPSTPCEGLLPFHTAAGLTHYYGVGAYRRPLTDVRRARVKFTPECLGLANVPDAETMERMLGGVTPPPHHPVWKAAVPRDAGAGWDFDDVRDHYLTTMFGADAVTLRSTDLERYYALSRVVSGELMLRVFAEWRRPDSGCGGGLVWFLKDLRPGAGWGILDSTGRPKSAYWYLRRAWARRAVLITDEGLDGLDLTIVNETGEPLDASLEVELWKSGRPIVAEGRLPVRVSPRASCVFPADSFFPTFSDLTCSYRFGPPRHDVVVARLVSSETGGLIHEDAYFPLGHTLPVQPAANLTATAELDGEDVMVSLHATTFVQAISLSSPGYAPDDNYFHASPSRVRVIRFRPVAAAKAFKAHITAINLEGTLTVRT